jgi:hypothetical protein
MENRKITFEKKPIPLPAEYRPMYQISIIVLVLKYCCRGSTSSLQKLHLFSWCLYSEKNMAALKYLIENNYKTQMPHWAIDPAVNRAIGFAIADDLCELTSNKKYKITKKGLDLVAKIEADDDLFISEKAFLCYIGKQITDEIIDKLTMKKR